MKRRTQQSIKNWIVNTFGVELWNGRERSLRVVEESVELAQALNVTADECKAVIDHVYERPKGDPVQELGGVMITIEAAAEYLGVVADEQAELEWHRIESLSQEHFDAAKQRKLDAGICEVEEGVVYDDGFMGTCDPND